MKAYILSTKFGTVQIGDTVFQPETGAIFTVPPISPDEAERYPVVEVPDASMESARKALFRVRTYGSFPSNRFFVC